MVLYQDHLSGCPSSSILAPDSIDKSGGRPVVKRISLADADCPVARALDVIGDWWSLLIIRDAFDGVRRFSDFQLVQETMQIASANSQFFGCF